MATSYRAIPIYLLTLLEQIEYKNFVIEIKQDFVVFCKKKKTLYILFKILDNEILPCAITRMDLEG